MNKIKTLMMLLFGKAPIVVDARIGDVLIFETTEHIPQSEAGEALVSLRELFPNNKIYLLNGLSLRNVLRVSDG